MTWGLLFLGPIAVFLLLGAIFHTGRGAALIAGYNTLPASEKAKYDERALTRFMARMMFALSFSMLFWVLSDLPGMRWLFGVGLVLFGAVTVFVLIYANTGNRFRKVEEQGNVSIGGDGE